MKISKLIEEKKGKPFISLEFFPPKEEKQLSSFFNAVESLAELNPLFTSVTYGAGGSSQDATLAITARLKHDYNFEPMSHLTCVGADEKSIDRYVELLQKAEIDNVLALRGDMPKNTVWDFSKGQFKYATNLIQYLKTKHSSLGIGMAAYPAPHPESPSFASDRHYTLQKFNMGADFAVSQLFFDVREYFDLVERAKASGITKPIIPGILPIQSFESMRKTLSMCGANIPGKLYLEMETAQNTGGIEAVKEAGIAFAVKQIKELLANGAPGIHLYTLNQASMCLKIVKELNL